MPLLPARAAMVDNERIIGERQGTLDRTTILNVLDRQDTLQQLQNWGVDPQQARARVNDLTQDELAAINRQLDDLRAGGDILGILLVIFIVFIITDAVGATDIFPFVHPVR
jgi:hypothetical protein